MKYIIPVSDLRNKFSKIEVSVQEGNPIFLSKNGYGTMVVLSIEQYSQLINNVKAKFDDADRLAEADSRHLTHNEVFV